MVVMPLCCISTEESVLPRVHSLCLAGNQIWLPCMFAASRHTIPHTSMANGKGSSDSVGQWENFSSLLNLTSSHQAPRRPGAMMGCEAACWAGERREEDCYYQSEVYSYWPHNWDTQLPGQSPLYNRNNSVKGGENHCINIIFFKF